MATNEEIELLKKKAYKAMTVFTNLQSFKDWRFAAYKVEEHEKDVVIEAVALYRETLEKKLKELQEESNDSPEFCE